jgi:serine/threonine protein kinase
VDQELSGSTISHYEIMDRIGGGGMGVVYRARDTRLNRIVALKFLPRELTGNEAARERFANEARTASTFDHPHVATVFDVGEADGRVFIAMAYAPGETLKERIARGPLGVVEAVDIALQITEGLIEAHEHGIAHRDIKPANVVLTHDGTVKIVDFGLANLVGLPPENEPGLFMGTLPYMSPEQLRNEPVDHRSDIWSLGVTLVEMLTGSAPFGRSDTGPVLFMVASHEVPPVSSQRPDVPPALDRVIARCLEKDRRQRYRSAVELHQELRRCRELLAAGNERSVGPMPAARQPFAMRVRAFLRRVKGSG